MLNLSNFQENIFQKKLFESGSKLLLAVSGGLDSVVMTHLLYKLKHKISIAHINYQLRGEDSEQDAIFTADLAKNLGVQFYLKTINLSLELENQSKSLQILAREVRYTWLKELKNQHQFDYILTAHHLNDNIETLLLNITRGTGWRGLMGIPEKKNGFVRPLLAFPREEILNYAQQEKLQWREDASNQTIKYKRNQVRREVIPILKSMNPNLEQTIQNHLEEWKLGFEYLRTHLEEKKAVLLQKKQDTFYLSIESLEKEKQPVFLLSELLRELGFSWGQVGLIWKSRAGLSGKIFYSSDYSLVKDREQYVIQKLSEGTYQKSFLIDKKTKEITLSNLIFIFQEITKDEGFQLSKSQQKIQLDKAQITFPLVLRKWQQGDYFIPLGMKGKKKVSDFLVDLKIPLNLKNEIWVLSPKNSQEIIWVVNYRIHHHYRIQENTKTIFEIKLIR